MIYYNITHLLYTLYNLNICYRSEIKIRCDFQIPNYLTVFKSHVVTIHNIVLFKKNIRSSDKVGTARVELGFTALQHCIGYMGPFR